MHLYSNSWKHKLWCVCLLNLPDYDLPQSMLKFINAERPQKSASEASTHFF